MVAAHAPAEPPVTAPTGERRGRVDRLRRVDSDRAFAAAYAATLASVLVSSGLTYLYVGPGVRELNPVIRGLIAWFGPGGMVAARFLVVIAAFRGYHLLRGHWPDLVVAFAWVGALVHLLDAAHDARVAVAATAVGFVPAGDVGGCLFVLAVGAVAGILLRPPASPTTAGGIARPTLRESG